MHVKEAEKLRDAKQKELLEWKIKYQVFLLEI